MDWSLLRAGMRVRLKNDISMFKWAVSAMYRLGGSVITITEMRRSTEAGCGFVGTSEDGGSWCYNSEAVAEVISPDPEMIRIGDRIRIVRNFDAVHDFGGSRPVTLMRKYCDTIMTVRGRDGADFLMLEDAGDREDDVGWYWAPGTIAALVIDSDGIAMMEQELPEIDPEALDVLFAGI